MPVKDLIEPKTISVLAPAVGLPAEVAVAVGEAVGDVVTVVMGVGDAVVGAAVETGGAAAVVGVAVGNLAREGIAAAHISVKAAAYFKALPISFLAFFVHGIFEILGYFIGAIAGGILSVAIIKRHYRNPHFSVLLRDIIVLLLLSAGLIILGAFVEVYITPVL